MRTKILSLSAAALLLGCYQPDLSGVHYTCTEPSLHPCPDGQVCVGGNCRPAADSPIDMSMASLDGGVLMMTDLPAGTSGCLYELGAFQPDPTRRVWACPGSFNKGEIKSRCKPGWRLCQGMPFSSAAFCKGQGYSWPAFFASELRASADSSVFPLSPGSATCDWSQRTRGVSGCGQGFGVYSAPACSNYPIVMACAQNNGRVNTAWDCSGAVSRDMGLSGDDQFVTQTFNKSAADGVLCCEG